MKLHYVTLLQQAQVKEAILYARVNFGRFCQVYANREGERSSAEVRILTLTGGVPLFPSFSSGSRIPLQQCQCHGVMRLFSPTVSITGYEKYPPLSGSKYHRCLRLRPQRCTRS